MITTKGILINVLPFKTWNVIIPYKTKSLTTSTIPLVAGHHNHIYKVKITNNSTPISNLKELYPIRLKKTDKYYKVGPLIGILTINGRSGFKGNRKNYIDIINMGIETGVFVFVLTPESINYKDKTVYSYIYLPNSKKWIRRIMPLPDVIYNRIPYRKDEQKINSQKAIKFLKNEDIPFFNPYFFNKWSLYQWMKESTLFKDIIPETNILTLNNFQKALIKNSNIYIKPIHGKAGIGFIKINNKGSYFTLYYQATNGTFKKDYYSFKELWKKINELTKKEKYIFQPGINLRTYKGNPYDVRVLVQKNGFGKWMVSGIGIRVAGQKSITTHVPRGGTIESVDKVFINNFGYEYINDWKDEIGHISLQIAEYLEKKTDHYLGELSLDLGIDNNGRIWFFEANSKPMEFDEPNIREKSLLRLTQYFRYLSGFTTNEVIS